MSGWIGVDFDGTLAEYDKWISPEHTGAPIPKMVDRVKKWLAQGKDVRIFTARVYSDGTYKRNEEAVKSCLTIANWCEKHIGQVLPITCTKDYGMYELWDDRAVQVIPNTGERADGN